MNKIISRFLMAGGRGLLVISLISVFLFSCAGPEAKKAKYIAKAEAYMKASNWPKARVSLQNVLKIDPKDAEAYYLFGTIAEKEENWKEAIGAYINAVALKPDHLGALIKMGRFYLIGRRYKEAGETADKILALSPGDTSAITIKAAILFSAGQLKEAAALAEEGMKSDPTAPDLVSLISTLYFSEGRVDEGEKALKRALEAHPENIVLLNNYADYSFRRGNGAEGEKTLRKMIELEPKAFGHRIRLAQFYDRNNQAGPAESVLREGIRLDPENEEERIFLADFLKAHKKMNEAEAFLIESKTALPNSMKVRFALGAIYEEQKDLSKARSVYEEISREKKTIASAEESEARLAAIDLAGGKRELAEVRLNELLKKNPNSAIALAIKGRIAKGKGDYKEAIQDFRTVLRDQPDRGDIHALLGESYLLSGENGLARESFDRAVSITPRLREARRGLALLEVREGLFKEARERIDLLLKENPADLDALGILLSLEMKGKNWTGAEKTLAQLRHSGGDLYSIEMAEGKMNHERKRWEEAKSAYARAEKIHPGLVEPLAAIIDIELVQGKKREAKARLEKTISAHPEYAVPHDMMGELLLVEKDETGAEKEFAKAAELKPDWIKPWLHQATLKIAHKDPVGALKIVETGLKSNPRSEELSLLKASTLESMGETDRAIRDYEAIIKNNPEDLLAVNNLVVLLTDKKGDPQSLEKAFSLSKDFEKGKANPALLDSLGWVYVKLGRGEDGVRVLRSAIVKAPKEPNLNYHLGIAYYKSGRLKDAKIYLTRAVQSGVPFVGAKEARATLTQIKG